MHKFKKHFGQNFLRNSKFINSLINSLNIQETDTIIEIGPGDGAITNLLLQKNCKVICIEIDLDLIPVLQNKFINFKNFNIYNINVLDCDFNNLLGQFNSTKSIKIIGALPYNISKKIISKCFEFAISNTDYKLIECSFIVQEEVAKVYASTPPNATFLYNYAKIFSDVKKLESIPKQFFYPIPKVNGGILNFKFNNKVSANYKDIIKLIKIGFSSPRKTLLNNLKASKKYSIESINRGFSFLNLKPNIRASEISLLQWENLFSIIEVENATIN